MFCLNLKDDKVKWEEGVVGGVDFKNPSNNIICSVISTKYAVAFSYAMVLHLCTETMQFNMLDMFDL